ncbi:MULTISPECIES: competence protein ComK [Halobacillus]|uniref:Competence protein ComK n=1 Tax=Halobacillus halophilus (strain ATCC 35676 / DSM 2266 / JCM 20832 / KCTC 3685 / LMG 17431 / NBRC 102448 / NCIMB 2269) TaxID=866895 RepID=I0JKC5_HALH3|nr:competence protein ComK [Halobacillus halophilus]ASF38739.1 competence protein ComK [Halobacillus halophilus]CCG44594.1 competence protein ComK [Halobacillus halophilus DSM 2266]
MEYLQKKEYEVNPQTMALIAKYDQQGQVITHVVEQHGSFEVLKCPSQVVDDSCRYFASSLEGRILGTKQVTSYTHKPPIVISEAMGIYFFPIISPKRKECSWIALKYIQTHKGESDHTTTIQFSNGTSLNLPVSVGMFANQLHRTAHFRFILEDRLHASQPPLDASHDLRFGTSS